MVMLCKQAKYYRSGIIFPICFRTAFDVPERERYCYRVAISQAGSCYCLLLDSLLNLAMVLDCLDDFDKLASESRQIASSQSLDALPATPAPRRRATGRKGRGHGV